MKTFLAFLVAMAGAGPGAADAPEIKSVTAREDAGGWTFEVTLAHPDTGWDHYANGWEVLTPDGTSLGVRDLTHPHVDEQPFTRSLSGVNIPDGVDRVLIRARCNLNGWAMPRYEIELR